MSLRTAWRLVTGGAGMATSVVGLLLLAMVTVTIQNVITGGRRQP